MAACCSVLMPHKNFRSPHRCDLRPLLQRRATSLLSDAYAPQDLPAGDWQTGWSGTITGDTLQVAVHNSTTWNIKEIRWASPFCAAPRPTARRGSAPGRQRKPPHAFRKTS
jgi:hypothetical protein